MYQLTPDPDIILYKPDNALVPRGHWMWEQYEIWLSEGNTPEPLPLPSTQERNEAIRQGVGRWMDEEIRKNGYDNMVSCITYVSSTNPKFAHEASCAVVWRDAVWARAYELLASPPAGVTTLEQVVELLPQAKDFGWPDRGPMTPPASTVPPIQVGV